jgi:hypothetical protein
VTREERIARRRGQHVGVEEYLLRLKLDHAKRAIARLALSQSNPPVPRTNQEH